MGQLLRRTWYARQIACAGPGTTFGWGVHFEGTSKPHGESKGISLGHDCRIGHSCVFATWHGIRFGDRCSLTHGALVFCGAGLDVGNDVYIGPGVKLLGDGHNADDTLTSMGNQGVYSRKIVIADDVWLGGGCIILAGVHIGEGSIVAAGAVVNRNVEPFSIVGGVPARLLKMRK